MTKPQCHEGAESWQFCDAAHKLSHVRPRGKMTPATGIHALLFSKRLAVETCQRCGAVPIPADSSGLAPVRTGHRSIFRQFVSIAGKSGFLRTATDGRKMPSSAFGFPAMPAVFSILAAVRWRAQAQVVSNFSVTTACLRTIVLAESGLLGRVVIRVIADNVTNQRGVRQTVEYWNTGLVVRHG